MATNKRPVPRHPMLHAVALATALLLGACGGGGGSSSAAAPATTPAAAPAAPAATVQTALYFTDDFSATYDAVWISVSRVTVISPAGELELLRHDTPQLINLPTLRRAGALMGAVNVPVDATELRVYVAPAARLQQLDGSLLDVTLQAPSGYLSFGLEGWDSRSGALALDFDLPNFRLQGNTLVAATRLAGHADLAGWNSRHSEVKGTVTAVSATSITVQTAALGTQTFALDAQTTFVSERTAGWVPVVGSVVELYSQVSGQGAQSLSFTARSVKDHSEAAADTSAKVHGRITAVDKGTITVSVDRSSLASATGSISIDVSQSRFARGTAAMLAPGLRIEAYLSRTAAGFVASTLEVEGGLKAAATAADSDDDGADDNDNGAAEGVAVSGRAGGYGEVKGVVSSVSGQQLVLSPLYAKGLSLPVPAVPLSLDLSAAYFERGGLACLVAGTPVEVKGVVSASGQLQAVKVELEGGCASAHPVSGLATPAATVPAISGASFVEAEGVITAVRTGEFDLQVYKLEYAGAQPATLTVRHGGTTVFKHLLASGLARGLFVEIKGSLLGQLLDAARIEQD